MIDDQARCEWVNVSSGTGQSRTTGHKTVVVMCCSSYTPCPEKNGTNNVLGITLANTNIIVVILA